jgi:hypothetical protein
VIIRFIGHGQHFDDEHADRFIILDDEYGLAGAQGRLAKRRLVDVRSRHAATAARQEELHGRAPAFDAVDADVSAGLLDEAVDHRQPKTGTLADRLGGEEGIERLGDDARRHADAVVAHADPHIIAGAQRFLVRGIGLIERRSTGRDGQRAARRHCVACVDGEVEQCVLELIGIRHRRPDVHVRRDRQRDLFAHCLTQEIFRRRDERVDVHRLRIERLAPREGEQSMGQPRRPLGRRGGAVHEAFEVGDTAVVETAPHHVERADDAGQDVVEVMREAAGELADGFHLLRLAELLLGQP